ncbi:hypothetical protein [Prescottella equi]|uniref:hypothetical protein n=1 Tax=Rhodococcus hoagii TaxID=43767 RepID=UPI0007CD78A7|nr:hypothetical protein [Prescottella equi]
MSRRISQSITPTAEDVAALRGPFTKKGANDPLIVELRSQLSDAPAWLAKLSEDQELTRERLAEIRAASAKRRSIIEALPEGDARDKALTELDVTEKIVEEMDGELAGVSAFSGMN